MNMRVMMIGFSGAGKTTYMGALYSLLNKKPCEGFSLRANSNSDHEKFLQIGARLARGIYPEGTDILQEYQYSLLYKGKNILEFDWYDYRGGVLASADSPDFDKVIGQIMDSDALVVFLDSTMFTPGENAERRCVNTWKRIMAIVQNVTARRSDDTVFPISFVLTKRDCFPEGANKTRGWQQFEQVVKMIRGDEHRKIFGVCVETAVRCIDQEYETFGLEYPFLFSMYAAMDKKYCEYAYALQRAIDRRNRLADEGGLIDEFLSWLEGKKSKWDRAEIEEAKAFELYQQAKELHEGPMKMAADYLDREASAGNFFYL